jgi:hypothetical protein
MVIQPRGKFAELMLIAESDFREVEVSKKGWWMFIIPSCSNHLALQIFTRVRCWGGRGESSGRIRSDEPARPSLQSTMAGSLRMPLSMGQDEGKVLLSAMEVHTSMKITMAIRLYHLPFLVNDPNLRPLVRYGENT